MDRLLFLWILLGILIPSTPVESPLDNTADNDEDFARLTEKNNRTLVAEYEWKVKDIHRLLHTSLSTHRDTIKGPEFYTGQPGYKVRLSVSAGKINPVDKLPYLGVWFALMPGKFDDVVEWPFQYKFNLTLVDQSNRRDPEHIHLSMNPMTAICRLLKQFLRPRTNKKDKDGCGKEFFVPHSKLLNSDRYLVNDTLLVRVTIFLGDRGTIPKRAKAYMRGHQLVSEFLWEIEDIDDKVQQARDGLLSYVTSDLFYVNSESYLMVLQLTINAEDEHLGLFTTLVPGDFDDTLEWPFSYNFELSIVDQSPGYLTLDRKGVVDPTSGICSLSSFTKPQYQPNLPCGFRRLINFQMLENRNFKKNGNLLVKFTTILDKMPNFASISVKDTHLISEYSWRVPNIERKVQLAKSGRLINLLSERFYTSDQGYLMQLQLKFQNQTDGFIGLYLTLLEGEYDTLVEWPFTKKFDLVIIDQQPAGNGKDILVSVDPRNPYITNEACVGSFWRPVGRNDACGSASTISYEMLYSKKYIRYGAMLVKVTVYTEEIHPPRFATLTVEEDYLVAKYIWTITDIDSKIVQAKRGEIQFIDSEKFYLTNNGYRMMLRVYPEKSFGYVGLYAVLTKGIYDQDLEWPFKYKYQLTVADQTEKGSKLHIRRTTFPSTSSSGCPDVAFKKPEQELAEWSCGEGRMISHETLNIRGYKKNGSMKVGITVFLKELSKNVANTVIQQGNMIAEYSWLIERMLDRILLLKSQEISKVESSVFYTNNQGYALRMSMALNAVEPSIQSLTNHGEEYVVGLYLTLFKGKYDAMMKWPFTHTVILTLVDQNNAARDLVKVIDPKNTKCPQQAFLRPRDVHNEHSCGFAALVSLERLQSYIREGSVLLKISVVLSEIRS